MIDFNLAPKKTFLFVFCMSMFFLQASAQEIITVQTLTYDSTGRDYVFDFPEDDGSTYERILMLYSMRCKGAQISVPGNTNLGCGEWDYSCNTYIEDSSYTDSLAAIHPTHVISGFEGEEFFYTNEPTNTYTQYIQKQASYTSTMSESVVPIGNGEVALNHPFNTSQKSGKTQYIWKASELSAAGLNAGKITGLQIEVDDALEQTNFLRIHFAQTTAEIPSSQTVLEQTLQQVYFLDSKLESGVNFLRFHEDFEWDGISNVLVQFSFTNGASFGESIVSGSMVTEGVGLTSGGSASNLSFTGSENVAIPTNGFNQISDEITISLWSYGDADVLPRSTTVFEAKDHRNLRQANVHLPWSNGQVYWDCGNVNGYDRINKTANPEDFSGRWNHWAFTKNASTGDMKIYLNGRLWHSGTGLTRPIDMRSMNLGSDLNGNNSYFGNIDEFRIWNVELDEATIATWMTRQVDDTHPYYDHLITHLTFNEGTGSSLENMAPAGGNATINGNANWKESRGNERITDFVAVAQRPNISFVSGNYTLSVDNKERIDTTQNTPRTITEYTVNGTDLEVVTVEQAWEAKPENLLSEEGEILDSYEVSAQGSISIGSLDYFRKFPSRFEIMSFVTPYGIFLDLGEEGETWTFDVTDFAPILKGSKRMFLTLGGQNQEEMDIKFVFIKGTPPREVKDIRQIWRAGRSVNNANIRSNASFEPVSYRLAEDGTYFKIRSAITGHGQEGEFIPRYHEVIVNEQNSNLWQVWKECADNPVYPQGGTWIYDRAGWCPGAPTDVVHWDITDLVEPGGIVNIDYTMNQATGDSRYIVSHQLVTYGPANFQHDARIADVMRPSDKIEYGRDNPVCNAPMIVLENTGAEILTSATISYRVRGGETLTYEWMGELAFLEREEIQLPLPDMSFWQGSGQQEFIVEVSNPNGQVDEYDNNNIYTSPFEMPDMIMEDKIRILTITNSLGYENSFRVLDFNQDTVFSREEMIANNIYEDEIELSDGCYTLEIDDTGDNGMEFWAQPSQGSGSLTILTEDQALIKNIDPDFGRRVSYSFVKGIFTNVEMQEPEEISFDIYPNPSSNLVNVKIAMNRSERLEIWISDITGNIIARKKLGALHNGIVTFDLSDRPDGMYMCTVISDSGSQSRKMVLQK